MPYLLVKILALLLDPGLWLLAVLAMAALFMSLGRHMTAARRLVTLAALILSLATLTPLAPWATALLEDRFPRPALPEGPIAGIIVLGGSIDSHLSHERGQPVMNGAVERLTEAARLARLYGEAKILVTGGDASPIGRPSPEAPYMAEILEGLGVAADRLLIENRSRDTYENAVFSRTLAKPEASETWLLITSARHMPRAMGVFAKVGWTVLPWPVDYLTSSRLPWLPENWVNIDPILGRLVLLQTVLHEWAGLLGYRIEGRIDSLFPAPQRS